MKRTALSLIPFAAALTLAAAPALAADIHVPGDWPTIQEGIDAAANGDKVIVGDGVWTGFGNKNLNFGGKIITVCSENGPDLCIIDCENSGRGFWFFSGESPLAKVEGFTIRNGRMLGGFGGAIYCQLGSRPTIEGCVFRSNQATGGGVALTGVGGAIYADASNITVLSCEFYDNVAGGGSASTTGAGGAILAHASDITVAGSYFESNRATSGTGGVTGFGGAIVIRESGPGSSITDCIFVDNAATGTAPSFKGFGGAISMRNSDVVMTRCDFLGNSCYRSGGAIWCSVGADPTFYDCLFDGNTATGDAAGVALSDNAQALFVRCTFVDNVDQGALTPQDAIGGAAIAATGGSDIEVWNSVFCNNSSTFGGAITHLTSTGLIVNSLFAHNEASVQGGAICNIDNANVVVRNCTIADNSAGESGGGIKNVLGSVLNVCNGIAYGNTAPVGVNPNISNVSATTSVSYSAVGGGWPGTGNTPADPLFVNPDGEDGDPGTWEDNDYRLDTGSPACDSGSNTCVPADSVDLDDDGDVVEQVPVDLDGLVRFFDDPAAPDTGFGSPPIVDMGAYERSRCPADITGDGWVDVEDLVEVILNWGECPGCAADITGDDQVAVEDLVEVILAWGPCEG